MLIIFSFILASLFCFKYWSKYLKDGNLFIANVENTENVAKFDHVEFLLGYFFTCTDFRFINGGLNQAKYSVKIFQFLAVENSCDIHSCGRKL